MRVCGCGCIECVCVWQGTFAAFAWWLSKKFSCLWVYPKWPKRLHFVPSWQLELATCCYAQLATSHVAQFIASYCCNNFSTHPFIFVVFFVLLLLHLLLLSLSLFSLGHFLIAKKLLLLLPHLSAASPPSSISLGVWGQRLLVIS